VLFRLSDQLAFILKWNRWANDRGKSDSNKPLDLKIEQVHRTFQAIMRRLGPNTAQSTILCYTDAAPALQEIREKLRTSLDLSNHKPGKKEEDRISDVRKVIDFLTKLKVFTEHTTARTINGFSTLPTLMLSEADSNSFLKAVQANQKLNARVKVFESDAVPIMRTTQDTIEVAVMNDVCEHEEVEEVEQEQEEVEQEQEEEGEEDLERDDAYDC